MILRDHRATTVRGVMNFILSKYINNMSNDQSETSDLSNNVTLHHS